MSRTDDDLNLLFAQFNRELFGGSLPIYFVRFTSEKDAGEGLDKKDGQTKPSQKLILIREGRRDGPEVELRRVLLHEMVHVDVLSRLGIPKLRHGHDGAFLAELARLRDRGESWAGEEIERYLPEAWGDQAELEPRLAEQLKAFVASEERSSVPPEGWQGRIEAETGTSFATFAERMAGIEFWYQQRRAERREADDLVRRKLNVMTAGPPDGSPWNEPVENESEP